MLAIDEPMELQKVRELIEDFDPAAYPCGLAAMLWYAYLALTTP